MMQERSSERSGTHSSDTSVNIRWDDANMRSVYSNACNVTGTREEIILLFGVHQAWQSGLKEVTVQLQDRVILNPYAAKRLNLLLGRVLEMYEARYGALKLEAAGQGGPGEPLTPI